MMAATKVSLVVKLVNVVVICVVVAIGGYILVKKFPNLIPEKLRNSITAKFPNLLGTQYGKGLMITQEAPPIVPQTATQATPQITTEDTKQSEQQRWSKPADQAGDQSIIAADTYTLTPEELAEYNRRNGNPGQLQGEQAAQAIQQANEQARIRAEQESWGVNKPPPPSLAEGLANPKPTTGGMILK